MGLHRLEMEILKRWKSFRRLFTFLEKEYQTLNQRCFEGKLPCANFHLKRMKFSWDPIGGAYVGAVYRPPASQCLARIEFSPLVLLEKADLRTALAHEMVHHWEWNQPHAQPGSFFPPDVREFSRERFPEPHRQYEWRLAHSSRFLAKAEEVAQALQLPIREFLFKKSTGLLL